MPGVLYRSDPRCRHLGNSNPVECAERKSWASLDLIAIEEKLRYGNHNITRLKTKMRRSRGAGVPESPPPLPGMEDKKENVLKRLGSHSVPCLLCERAQPFVAFGRPAGVPRKVPLAPIRNTKIGELFGRLGSPEGFPVWSESWH